MLAERAAYSRRNDNTRTRDWNWVVLNGAWDTSEELVQFGGESIRVFGVP